jgi:hypothetical protein
MKNYLFPISSITYTLTIKRLTDNGRPTITGADRTGTFTDRYYGNNNANTLYYKLGDTVIIEAAQLAIDDTISGYGVGYKNDNN